MDYLRAKGIDIGRYKVRRLMREMDIHAIYPKKKITTKEEGHKTYPYLLENLDIYKSDLVWVSDITYIPLKHGTAYLTAVMDWHSRYINFLGTINVSCFKFLYNRTEYCS